MPRRRALAIWLSPRPTRSPASPRPRRRRSPSRRSPSPIADLRSPREPLALPDGTWWARVALPGAAGILFATNDAPDGMARPRADLFPRRGTDRIRRSRARPLSRRGVRRWPPRRRAVRRTRRRSRRNGAIFARWSAARASPRSGPVICACFGVGLAAIHEALASRKAANVEEIGLSLRAGTKCGTCLPELRSIVDHDRHAREHAHAV